MFNVPKLEISKHRKMFEELHLKCNIPYDLSVTNCINKIYLLSNNSIEEDKEYDHMEYCLLVLPYLLPYPDKWKYGLGSVLHMQAKMHSYIREGIHPVEYLYKKFIL